MAGGPMLALLLDPPFQLFQGAPGPGPAGRPPGARDRPVGPRGRETSRRTRRSSRRRSDRSWPAARPPWQSSEPVSDRRSGPRSRPRAALPPSSAHNRRSPPSPPGRPGWRAARRPTRPGLPACSASTSAANRADAGVDFALCDIEADKSRLLWHHPTPFLARAGSHAHATVRVEEDAGPVPRSPAGSALGAHGLRSGDGRLLEQPPVRPLWHILRTQGGELATARRSD